MQSASESLLGIPHCRMQITVEQLRRGRFFYEETGIFCGGKLVLKMYYSVSY